MDMDDIILLIAIGIMIGMMVIIVATIATNRVVIKESALDYVCNEMFPGTHYYRIKNNIIDIDCVKDYTGSTASDSIPIAVVNGG